MALSRGLARPAYSSNLSMFVSLWTQKVFVFLCQFASLWNCWTCDPQWNCQPDCARIHCCQESSSPSRVSASETWDLRLFWCLTLWSPASSSVWLWNSSWHSLPWVGPQMTDRPSPCWPKSSVVALGSLRRAFYFVQAFCSFQWRSLSWSLLKRLGQFHCQICMRFIIGLLLDQLPCKRYYSFVWQKET